MLTKRNHFNKIWEQIKSVPPIWSFRFLEYLLNVEWMPKEEIERNRFINFTKIVKKCQQKNLQNMGALIKSSIIFRDQTGWFDYLSISPDGEILATGNIIQNAIVLRRLSDGSEFNALIGNLSAVWCVAFNPHSSILASGSADGSVRLWEFSKGDVLNVLNGHTQNVTRVAFSPNGKWLASCSWDKTIKIWDVSNGSLLKNLIRHSSHIQSIVFNPDGQSLASSDKNGNVLLWDLCNGKLLNTLKGHHGAIWCLAISPNGQILASGGEDQKICLWNVPNGNLLKILTRHTDSIYSLAFSPDGKMLASGGGYNDKCICLWQIPEGEILESLSQHNDYISCLEFSPDARLLTSGSIDRTIRLWSITPYYLLHKPIMQITNHEISHIKNLIQRENLSETNRAWLELIIELRMWAGIFEIEIEEMSKSPQKGIFDIEID